MMEKPQLSLIVTAHTEGILAHKTMSSLFRALQPLATEQISYEIIIHIDRGDPATIGYFSRYRGDPGIRLIYSDFGDPGLSRNKAIAEARGDYVALLDADDLVSGNWLIEAWRLLQSDPGRLVVRPEVLLTFAEPGSRHSQTAIYFNYDSESKEQEAIRMVIENPWPYCLMAARELLLAEPYPADTRQTGYEDYTLNANLIAHGVSIKVAPQTILFYRKTDDGLLAQHNRKKVLFHYTDLLETGFLQSIELSAADEPAPESSEEPADQEEPDEDKSVEEEVPRSLTWRFFRAIFYAVMKIPGIRSLAWRLYWRWLHPEDSTENKEGQQADDEQQLLALPDWLLAEWAAINSIEFDLFPSRHSLEHRVLGTLPNSTVGWVYRRLIDGLPPTIDYLFIVPWLAHSGITRALTHYIDALTRVYPHIRIAVLTTVFDQYNGQSQLPEDVGQIDFASLADGLAESIKESLMNRLIVQLKVANIHVIESQRGYDWLRQHSEFIEQSGLKVFVTAFDHEADSEGRRFSYIDYHIAKIEPIISKATAGQQGIIDEAVERCGMSADKWALHQLPAELPANTPLQDRQASASFQALVKQDIKIAVHDENP